MDRISTFCQIRLHIIARDGIAIERGPHVRTTKI
jgi:hypothetical protein